MTDGKLTVSAENRRVVLAFRDEYGASGEIILKRAAVIELIAQLTKFAEYAE